MSKAVGNNHNETKWIKQVSFKVKLSPNNNNNITNNYKNYGYIYKVIIQFLVFKSVLNVPRLSLEQTALGLLMLKWHISPVPCATLANLIW